MAEVDKWSIDKLDSSNWTTWKFQMKHLLLAKGLWGIVNGRGSTGKSNSPAGSRFHEEVSEGIHSSVDKFLTTIPDHFL